MRHVSNIHEIELPKKVIVGSGAIKNIVDVVKTLGKSSIRIGIVTGNNTYKAGGYIVEKILGEIGAVSVWLVENATLETANNVYVKALEEETDVIIGVGGGKSIDIAKYAGSKANIPVISVPLSPSHDGIISPFSTIKGTDRPYSIRTSIPFALVADIDLISKAPKRLILSGIGDLLGKFVSVKDWALAHKLKGEYYGEYSAQLALLSAKHVLRYHELIASATPEGIRILIEALISSGVSMCIAGSSRPASGSEHLFAHALEKLAPGKALHGEAVALGSIIMLYIYGDSLWKKIRLVMKKIGLPTTAQELGLQPEILVDALTISHSIRPERYTILGENGISKNAAVKILRETGII